MTEARQIEMAGRPVPVRLRPPVCVGVAGGAAASAAARAWSR